MADFEQVVLPPSVEKLIGKICRDRSLPPPDTNTRQRLASLGEEASLDILHKISSTCSPIRNFSGFICYMAKNASPMNSTNTHCSSPHNRSPSFPYGRENGSPCSPVRQYMGSPSSSTTMKEISSQLLALGELEFRKAFLILSYIGSSRLEDVVTAEEICYFRDLPMENFEFRVWNLLGRRYVTEEDRRKSNDWDSGCCIYHCHVLPDGSHTFKGPFINNTSTHMQRVLGDENILMVKFTDDVSYTKSVLDKIAKEGILVGLRRYRFFVFKDGGKEEKRKTPTGSPVRCYFVCTESNASIDCNRPCILYGKSIPDARNIFMNIHMVSSVAEFMARFSLILSKTMKLEIDLANVHVEEIDDICCQNEDGSVAYNKDGGALRHTDGTGFISEDIALKCPKNLFKGKCINHEGFSGNVDVEEKFAEFRSREPPLLMQVRLFKNGCAVKGTLLVNRTLPPSTIQFRPSMRKVKPDVEVPNSQTVNSLEIVSTSHKPKKTRLSRNLIALLCYGGVPKEYFMGILINALEEAQSALFNKRKAFTVSLRYGDMDDYTVTKMISSGIPLKEPFLQHRLSILMNEERKNLKGGKLPIDECFYMMGTADPTGMLKNDQVCIILKEGQLSGEVIVYRPPGLHFGDIHVLNATYIKEMQNFVGNAKYAIFFPTKGHRSLADEMAGGDFDGDLYFVSRNPQLLQWFKPSDPWIQHFWGRSIPKKTPSDYSPEDLEHELFQLFVETRFFPCRTAGVAADSCMSFMDRLLVLGDDYADEKARVKEQMLQLIDIYYESLDAAKSGKKIDVPKELRATRFPHFMERENGSYRSTSILGQIYDAVDSFRIESPASKDGAEIWTLPCFDVEVPDTCLDTWKALYEAYKQEMHTALGYQGESKNESPDAVIKKYKQILYGGPEFCQRTRTDEDICNDALAIYQISYANAKEKGCVGYCQFPWRVAGPALLALYRAKQGEKSLVFTLSVAKELF